MLNIHLSICPQEVACIDLTVDITNAALEVVRQQIESAAWNAAKVLSDKLLLEEEEAQKVAAGKVGLALNQMSAAGPDLPYLFTSLTRRVLSVVHLSLDCSIRLLIHPEAVHDGPWHDWQEALNRRSSH